VVAHADANRNHAHDAGDVMIAEIVDSNGAVAVPLARVDRSGTREQRIHRRSRDP
jgi:hypothetical protein